MAHPAAARRPLPGQCGRCFRVAAGAGRLLKGPRRAPGPGGARRSRGRMSRARGVLCRACLALAAALAALLLLPLPRAPAPAPASTPGSRAPPARASAPRLRPDDVFIAVKTTRKNHGPRLGLLLRTWISRARRQVGPASRLHTETLTPRTRPSSRDP